MGSYFNNWFRGGGGLSVRRAELCNSADIYQECEIKRLILATRSTEMFEAVEKSTKAEVTLCCLRTPLAQMSKEAASFIQRIQFIDQLDICKVHFRRYGIDFNNNPFVIVDPIYPIFLVNLCREPKQTTDAFKDLYQQLAKIHSAGFCLGDISEHSFAVNEDNAVIFLSLLGSFDYGTRKAVGKIADEYRSFVPNEQLNGERPDPATDVYALGVLLYYVLTGRRFVLGLSKESHENYVKQYLPNLLKSYEGKLPWVRGILEKSLRWDPKDRFQNAGELYANLCEARESAGVYFEEKDKPTKRKRGFYVGGSNLIIGDFELSLFSSIVVLIVCFVIAGGAVSSYLSYSTSSGSNQDVNVDISKIRGIIGDNDKGLLEFDSNAPQINSENWKEYVYVGGMEKGEQSNGVPSGSSWGSWRNEVNRNQRLLEKAKEKNTAVNGEQKTAPVSVTEPSVVDSPQSSILLDKSPLDNLAEDEVLKLVTIGLPPKAWDGFSSTQLVEILVRASLQKRALLRSVAREIVHRGIVPRNQQMFLEMLGEAPVSDLNGDVVDVLRRGGLGVINLSSIYVLINWSRFKTTEPLLFALASEVHEDTEAYLLLAALASRPITDRTGKGLVSLFKENLWPLSVELVRAIGVLSSRLSADSQQVEQAFTVLYPIAPAVVLGNMFNAQSKPMVWRTPWCSGVPRRDS